MRSFKEHLSIISCLPCNKTVFRRLPWIFLQQSSKFTLVYSSLNQVTLHFFFVIDYICLMIVIRVDIFASFIEIIYLNFKYLIRWCYFYSSLVIICDSFFFCLYLQLFLMSWQVWYKSFLLQFVCNLYVHNFRLK